MTQPKSHPRAPVARQSSGKVTPTGRSDLASEPDAHLLTEHVRLDIDPAFRQLSVGHCFDALGVPFCELVTDPQVFEDHLELLLGALLEQRSALFRDGIVEGCAGSQRGRRYLDEDAPAILRSRGGPPASGSRLTLPRSTRRSMRRVTAPLVRPVRFARSPADSGPRATRVPRTSSSFDVTSRRSAIAFERKAFWVCSSWMARTMSLINRARRVGAKVLTTFLYRMILSLSATCRECGLQALA